MKTEYNILFVIFMVCWYSSAQEMARPNILWISAEDISPAFGCYGDKYATTPYIDELAKNGLVFTNAFSTAPICSPSRSALITGLYATSAGTQNLRSEINIPDYLKTIPEILREEGYYCTNNSKTDYNFDPKGRWNENGKEAHWKNRPRQTPFFSVYNFGETHEGNGNSTDDTFTKEVVKKHNPQEAQLPVYFPKTEEFKKIWARYYDLITVFDKRVGSLVAELKASEEFENTIIFVFSDHGFGLPRYKRWLYSTGLHVPLVMHIPERYRDQFRIENGTNNQMVSFIDFAPTVLELAGIDATRYMQGQSVFSPDNRTDHLLGARSRADDVYDISRSIRTKDFMYIRNYMPHLPYIQNSLIFSDKKNSFAELLRLKSLGKLNPEAEEFWNPKATEELYYLKNDLEEVINIANNPKYQDVLKNMREKLHTKILESKDIGFLHESEYMERSKNITPYDYAQSKNYRLNEIYEAAELVGRKEVSNAILYAKARDNDSGVRFWAIVALRQRLSNNKELKQILLNALDDSSPAVALIAAETLCAINMENRALPVIEKYLKDERPTVVLQAAMTARLIERKASPLVNVVEHEFEKYKGDVWGRYKNWYYPMFIGFAFDQILMNCSVE
ncbi:sulfatase-like hydrolase/transferase [Kriegella aquimaris]|uniref:HEAT repeat-containing protein n=1 Tax=Kriegella aquimaris TaxID=192904 RepID=A0A1G9V422_9FLAO|nr:sulfatase-like hydrolase/transferase [Kriegella aquimaris]SDM66827.1 HEAT repeat-containing protein [Kriegella aquimaris]